VRRILRPNGPGEFRQGGPSWARVGTAICIYSTLFVEPLIFESLAMDQSDLSVEAIPDSNASNSDFRADSCIGLSKALTEARPSTASLRVSNIWVDRGSSCDCQTDGLKASFAAVSRTASLKAGEDSDVFLLVVRGEARVESREGQFWLPKDRWISFGRGAAPLVVTQSKSVVLALLLPAEVRHPSLPTFFPAQGVVLSKDRRMVLRLWRSSRKAAPGGHSAQLLLGQSLYLLNSLQREQRRLIGLCPGHTQDRKRQTFFRLQRALLFLEGNLDRPCSLKELASLCSMSTWYFTKTFKAVYGLGPREMTSAIRIRRASDLLAYTSLSIGDIAHQSGFQSSCTFARAFRIRFGMSASSYRTLKKGANPSKKFGQHAHVS